MPRCSRSLLGVPVQGGGSRHRTTGVGDTSPVMFQCRSPLTSRLESGPRKVLSGWKLQRESALLFERLNNYRENRFTLEVKNEPVPVDNSCPSRWRINEVTF